MLLIAVLLRFMDSFMIYTEPFVAHRRRPRQLRPPSCRSRPDVKMAVGQFDLGPAAALSIIYFLIILLLCVDLLHRDDHERRAELSRRGGKTMTATTQPLSQRLSWLIPTVYILFLLLPIYWLVNMSFKDERARSSARFSLWPQNLDPAATTR